jgi:hypothetical protein
MLPIIPSIFDTTDDTAYPNVYFTLDITFTTSSTYYFVISDQPTSSTFSGNYVQTLKIPINNIVTSSVPYLLNNNITSKFVSKFTPKLTSIIQDTTEETNIIIPKSLNTSDYSKLIELIQLPVNIEINEHTPFHIKLNNWTYILKQIIVHSSLLYNFSASIGNSNEDPNPVFICNPYLKNINESYLLSMPRLKNIHNKYIYLSITINNTTINFNPIQLTKTLLTLKNKETNYKLKNKNETHKFSVISKAEKLYIYADTIPYDKVISKLDFITSFIAGCINGLAL